MGRLAGYPSTQGYGHSTIEMACEVAQAADVHRLALFHHDPAYDDSVLAENEAHARALFPAATMAYEGLEIAIPIQATVPMGRDVKYAAHGQC
jgi:ribonuclease BN (tRNA processing enzyme)